MNSIIKLRGRAADVQPIKLTPVGSDFDDDADVSDLSLVKDPLVRARLEARNVMLQAQEEAAAVRREAYDEGYRAGMREAAEAASGLIQRLESDIAQLDADRTEVLGALEPQVLKLCMEIVEKVIRHEARTDPRVVMRVVKSCLRRVKDSEQVCIRVSPDELEEVMSRRDELAGLAQGLGELRIVDDRRVSPGGCVVESSAGDFDARIESQLSKIEDRLRETRENGCHDHAAEPG